MNIKEQLADKSADLHFVCAKFDEVADLFLNSQPSNRNYAAETCSVWAQRFNRYLVKDAKVESLTVEKIDGLIFLVIDRWSGGDPSYKSALKKFMVNVLSARQKLDPNADVKPLVLRCTSYFQNDMRICFGALDSIARSVSVLNALPPNFLSQSFESLVTDEGTNMHLIGRCLVGILGSESPDVWYLETEKYITSPQFYQPCMTYFIQPVLQQRPNANSAFLRYYELCKELRQSDPSVEIGVLKAAKNAKLEVGDLVNQSTIVKQALSLSDKRLKFDALQLICCANRKLTAKVPMETLDAIIEAGPALFAEDDPKSRSDVCSALRNLLIRLDTSKSDRTRLDEFVIEWCTLSLVPGAPYRCLAMSTKLLDLFKPDLSLYPKLVSNLLNGILSDYADIRGQCVELLGDIQVDGLQVQFDEIKSLAFSLLQSSRGGDAGARILQFLDSRMSNNKVIDEVVLDLERKLEYAKTDIKSASREFAIHGYFIALRLLALNERAVQLVDLAWDVCTPPLMSLAPEGMDENTLNFCWKACKESSLLIEACPKNLLMTSNPKKLLDKMALMLSDMTHWGAFSSIPPAFIAVARCDPDYALKLVWNHINELESRVKSRSVTRRSAGLPMLITSSLTVKFDNDVVDALFKLATLPFVDGEAEELEMPQVHGMNCLRAVLTDAELTKQTTTFIERGVQLALEQFRSSSWSLRNCAAMLFTGLFKRLFGVRGLQMAGSVFFQRYRSLKDIIFKQLDTSNVSNDSIFPALSILAQLHTTRSTDDTMDIFWEPIIELLSSPSWKIREMAARAVGAMTHSDNAVDCASTFIHSMSGKTNEMHGYSMAINALLSKSNLPSTDVDAGAMEKLKNIIQSCRSMEVNTSLMKAYKKLGGEHRLVEFNDLPKPKYLNPSIATFEAEQVQAGDDVYRYAKNWTPVLEVLPQWTPQLAIEVAKDGEQLPNIRVHALNVLQSSGVDVNQLAHELIRPSQPLSVQREALVLLAPTNDEVYVPNLLKFGADESPIECRLSAALSIKAYIEAKQPHNDDVLYLLYKLLSDEDSRIRLIATQAASNAPNAISPTVCEVSVLKSITPEYLTSKLIRNIVEDAEASISSSSISKLFVIEEESLYRDELRGIRLEGTYCAKPTPAQLKSVETAREILSHQTSLFANSNKDICRVRARIAALTK